MKKSALSLILATFALGLIPCEKASAQNAVLAEMYGRGVHAYYCGLNDEASQYLTMSIDNGIQDPRAYYFRGMVAYSEGKIAAAEADWQVGAELEASGRGGRVIGRSLARFQGAGRIKLEEIRQRARLNALAVANERSKQRYGELGVPATGTAPGAAPAAAPRPAPRASVTPPPIPPDTENPFADDMAAGDASVAADDALEGAMNDPFAGEGGAADTAAPAGGDPFGGDAGGADPFGGDAGGADPFGGDAGADPFGDDGSDPFGG